MLLNRSQLPWAWFTLLATLALVAIYVGAFYPAYLPWLHLPASISQPRRQHYSVGNSPLGLAYGAAAYAIFIFAVLLNTRKKFPLVRVGRVQTWLRAHIWLTILTLPLVFMHAAFRFGGVMTSSLMWLYLLVMLSGFYGLALQQVLPRQMKLHLPLETIYEQIPYLTRQLLASAQKMRGELRPAAPTAASVDAPKVMVTPTLAGTPAQAATAPAPEDQSAMSMLDALERDIIPYLAARHPDRSAIAHDAAALEFFRSLRLRVAPAYQERVDLLAGWCAERRQMLLQARYHHWLHGWLLVHVPASFLLIILTGWHAVVTLFLY